MTPRTFPRAGTLRILAAAALPAAALVCVSGCAKTGMPGGGPRDTEPPTVVSTAPADGEAGTSRESVISVAFSEEMDRTSVERALSVDPDVALGRFDWEGPRLTAQPETLLPDSTTIVVSIGEGARDYHGVALSEPFSFAFSTGPSVAAGTITGVVTLGGSVTPDATVWACPGPVAADSAGLVSPCEYQAVTGPDGNFAFRNVRTYDSRYSLVAFLDADGDGAFDSGRETGWIASYRVLIDAPGDSTGGIVLELVPPPSEGSP
ncbi:MAG: hypothetical protein GF405_10040 [Candidatus Eisenbacteria bacterium]|nr:hypothetical protein [Candidatus Eisenbacteria bacterium]